MSIHKFSFFKNTVTIRSRLGKGARGIQAAASLAPQAQAMENTDRIHAAKRSFP